MMGRLTERAFFGTALAALGVGAWLMELLRYWLYGAEIEVAPVAIGGALGFVGMYMLDSKRAVEGGRVLVDSATRLIVAVRSGRRSTDSVAIVSPTAEPETPAVPPKEDLSGN